MPSRWARVRRADSGGSAGVCGPYQFFSLERSRATAWLCSWHTRDSVTPITDPMTRKVEPKEMYCERLDDVVVCGGIYKH